MSLFGQLSQAYKDVVNAFNTPQPVASPDEPDLKEVAELLVDSRSSFGMPVSDDGMGTSAERAAGEIMEAMPKDKNGMPDSQSVYLKAIELYGEPKTPEDYHFIARVYSLCHVEYTLYAIKYLEKYIAIREQPTDEELVVDEIEQMNYPWLTPDIKWGDKMSEPWLTLGMLHEKAHEYEEALKCYQKALDYDKWSHFPYIRISEVYVKLNDLDKSVEILEKAQRHPNYKHKNGDEMHLFKKVIDDYYLNALKRRKAGRIFKPRGHREFLTPPEEI